MSGPNEIGKCPSGMVYIPTGVFTMGSGTDECGKKIFEYENTAAECPAKVVEISAYCLDEHEVTNAEYLPIATQQSTLQLPYPPPRGLDKLAQPIVNVTWAQADTYCRLQKKRLPTEAEWERAAKGPLGTARFATRSGKFSRDEAHYNSEDQPTSASAPVCSYPKNGFGVCDLMGNVGEWTADWYRPDAYITMAEKDPKGPAAGAKKSTRGGSWNDRNPIFLRSTARSFARPATFDDFIGLRCASTPEDVK